MAADRRGTRRYIPVPLMEYTMSETPDARRKRLLFQSCHRGMRETDIILGRFAARHLDDLDEERIERFEALLEETDVDLLNWITGAEAMPAHLDHDLVDLIRDFLKTP